MRSSRFINLRFVNMLIPSAVVRFVCVGQRRHFQRYPAHTWELPRGVLLCI
jgi:hypothetical protein